MANGASLSPIAPPLSIALDGKAVAHTLVNLDESAVEGDGKLCRGLGKHTDHPKLFRQNEPADPKLRDVGAVKAIDAICANDAVLRGHAAPAARTVPVRGNDRVSRA